MADEDKKNETQNTGEMPEDLNQEEQQIEEPENTQEKQFDIIAKMMDADPNNPEIPVLFDKVIDYAAKNPDPKDEIPKYNLFEIEERVMYAKSFLESDDDVFAKFLKESRDNEVKRVKELEKKAELTELEQKEFSDLKFKSCMEVNNFDGKGPQIEPMSMADYAEMNAYSPQVVDDFIKQNREYADPHVLGVQGKIDAIKQETKTSPELAGKDDEVQNRNAISQAFADSFNSPVNAAFSTMKLAFMPQAFASGIVIKSTIGLFMKTEAGQELSQLAKNKMEKIFPESPANKKSSKMKKGLLGLAAAGIVGGAIALGVEDALPPGLQTAFDQAAEAGLEVASELKQAYDNDQLLAKAQEMGQGMLNGIKSGWSGLGNLFGSDPSDAMSVANEAAAPTTPEVPAITTQEMTVPKGATLEGIARQDLINSGVNPESITNSDIRERTLQIAELNGIADADKIREGQVITTASEYTPLDGIDGVKLSSLDDIKNLDIAYGQEIKSDDLLNKIIERAAKESFGMDENRMQEFALTIRDHLAEVTDENGYITSMDNKMNLSHAVEYYLQTPASEAPNRLADGVAQRTLQQGDMLTQLSNETKPDVSVNKNEPPSYNNRHPGLSHNAGGAGRR